MMLSFFNCFGAVLPAYHYEILPHKVYGVPAFDFYL